MSRLVTLEFYPETFSFSAGHFTVFSATERERLHGHNYSVAATIAARIQEPGITFNYLVFKKRLLALCEQLDRHFLIAEKSPYLKIVARDNYYDVTFGEDEMSFLKKDALILPVENTTLEDLSKWIAEQLVADSTFIRDNHIEQLTIKVFNGPEQSAAFSWHR
jgi:6-pyruvoyltetrahydropterin/6-carboxytetrahydropterin synthase